MAGRTEILTEELAKRIARMIELFPDSEIPVTWDNVIAHSKKRFGYGGSRQMFGSKEWDGRKIIAEAFSEAKSVQRRLLSDARPKYRNAPRSILQRRIMELEAQKLALKDELEKVRAQQICQFDTFLNDTTDIRQLLEQTLSAVVEPVDQLSHKRKSKGCGTSTS